MQQQSGALQMTQELHAQAGAFRRAFDQAGNVGNHKTFFVGDAHHAEVRVQRGKRIVGNLRPRVRDRRDEGRFAGVGHTKQADVG